eukprot:10703466-Alexandrium_andersonii.AAC.1
MQRSQRQVFEDFLIRALGRAGQRQALLRSLRLHRLVAYGARCYTSATPLLCRGGLSATLSQRGGARPVEQAHMSFLRAKRAHLLRVHASIALKKQGLALFE